MHHPLRDFGKHAKQEKMHDGSQKVASHSTFETWKRAGSTLPMSSRNISILRAHAVGQSGGKVVPSKLVVLKTHVA